MIKKGVSVNSAAKKIFIRYRTFFQLSCLFFAFLITGWIWHYSNNEEAELKLYALQAIAEIIVAVFETIATFLMLKSIKQNAEANREMKRMNEKLQFSMQAQTDVLRQQQEFYALQLKERQDELCKLEKAKILNRYLSYVKNFLFAYNRGENFDGVNTKELFKKKSNENKVKDINETASNVFNHEDMLMAVLKLKLTPNTDLEHYMFVPDDYDKNGKPNDKIVLTKIDRDVKERFDCLLREYKYKLRTNLPLILGEYFNNFDENEELQELCG